MFYSSIRAAALPFVTFTFLKICLESSKLTPESICYLTPARHMLPKDNKSKIYCKNLSEHKAINIYRYFYNLGHCKWINAMRSIALVINKGTVRIDIFGVI